MTSLLVQARRNSEANCNFYKIIKLKLIFKKCFEFPRNFQRDMKATRKRHERNNNKRNFSKIKLWKNLIFKNFT